MHARLKWMRYAGETVIVWGLAFFGLVRRKGSICRVVEGKSKHWDVLQRFNHLLLPRSAPFGKTDLVRIFSGDGQAR